MLGCKSICCKSCCGFFMELIDTCWDVNQTNICGCYEVSYELIDTCWDVNQDCIAVAVST